MKKFFNSDIPDSASHDSVMISAPIVYNLIRKLILTHIQTRPLQATRFCVYYIIYSSSCIDNFAARLFIINFIRMLRLFEYFTIYAEKYHI